jgi:diaminohydroxyphosphoribosylaminopyrimidine deaminase/5-amino-6-(5-phosphoribosylamino)uracil reductase
MVTDADYMARALFHAARAVGATTPNPVVGAVVVRDGVVVGQGWHRAAGTPHAETEALDEAGERARGATLYVTLEPCCHAGRTGPCTKRILAAGIARVVVAMRDPNPAVNGKGIAELEASGVTVDSGIAGGEAQRLNRPFVWVVTRKRPYVVAKAAVSLDGHIAAAPGTRTAITSAEANRRAQRLRASLDAVAVGSGTVITDDPLLTVRDRWRYRPLVRAVFDRRLRTPPRARLLSTLADGPVIIVTTAAAASEAPGTVEGLTAAGATVVTSDGTLASGIACLLDWQVSSLLLEGGATVHRAAWDAGLIDEVHLVVGPSAIGARGVPLFDGAHVPLPPPIRVETLGPDTWMEFDVHGNR